MTEIKLISGNRYLIIVKAFDHITKSLVILLYKYYIETGKVEFANRLNICKPLKDLGDNQCYSMFFVSYITFNDWLFYCECTEDDDMYYYTCKKVYMENPESIEMVK